MIVEHVISHYFNNGSRVAHKLSDATKVSDRLAYCKLFGLLLTRHLLSVLIRMLLNMCTNQQARVLWKAVCSDVISVVNGIKQSRVISSILCLFVCERVGHVKLGLHVM